MSQFTYYFSFMWNMKWPKIEKQIFDLGDTKILTVPISMQIHALIAYYLLIKH